MQTNILEWLEQRCRQTPDKIAFGDRQDSLSYAQTAAASKTLACGLKNALEQNRAAAGPENAYPHTDPDSGPGNAGGNIGSVAIYMDKTVHTLCGMFGVVYAGGYYSNIDTQFPSERVTEILKSLKPAAILTDASHYAEASSRFSEYAPVLSYDLLQESSIDKPWLAHVRSMHCDTNPLYCNFTSGSTGTPKGVLVSHRSVIDFISIFVEEFGIGEQDILANQAPLDFDVSVKDIYSGMAAGARVQLIPREYFSTPVDLMDYLDDTEATILIWAVSAMCFVSTMRGFQYKVPHRLRQVMFSGEVMPIKQLQIWKKYLPDAVYVNLYGPTEITCNCTYYRLKEEDFQRDSIPIGKPFKNEKVFLLDEEQRLVADAGQTGEICVSGSCVAVGYLNRLDSKEFTQHPCNTSYYERIYRTGDLGYWRKDGNLMYVGRKDFQIKHLGHRIELSEIERCCEAMPEDGVARSCCIYYKQKQRLLLFYEGTAQEEDVHRLLADRLPHFMLPNNIVRISRMPMNKNGKIDRDRLLQIFLKR